MSTSLLDKVSTWTKNAQYWLMPGVCILCRQASKTTRDLCDSCRASFAPLENPCFGCALALPGGDFGGTLCGKCQDQSRLIQRTIAGFAYQPPVAGLIGQFKYRAKLQHGRVLTDLLLNDIQASYQTSLPPQLLLPVPLHPSRLKERGYNQAFVMAQQLGRTLHIPVAHDVLKRVSNTEAQQGLSARERKQNLRGAFAMDASGRILDLTSIALVDDVVTTMSTVRELARMIKNNVPKDLEIHVWCLARA